MLELILAVMAWKKGWKGYALLPLMFTLIAGVMLGVMNAPTVLVVPIDLLGISILVLMIKLAPQNSVQPTADKTLATTERR